MGDAPAAAAPNPCCVCAAPAGNKCTKCKSRHYCGKACQLVDWNERGHKAVCRQMAADFQDRLLDELMPLKMKIKEEPPIVADVAPAAGSRAAARLSAVPTATTAAAKASAQNDKHDWRGTCAICLDLLPRLCTKCSNKCDQYDTRCPLCRTPASKSSAETLRQVQKHVDKGNVEAQMHLANVYHHGTLGLKKSPKRAFQMCELAAAQGDVKAQFALGSVCYDSGEGAKINYKTAARWLRSAAEQGHPGAQLYLGAALYIGKGVAQSHDEAVQWFRLAAAQGDADGLYSLGMCYATGEGVPQDPRGGTTPLQARRGAGARRRSGGGRAQIEARSS